MPDIFMFNAYYHTVCKGLLKIGSILKKKKKSLPTTLSVRRQNIFFLSVKAYFLIENRNNIETFLHKRIKTYKKIWS